VATKYTQGADCSKTGNGRKNMVRSVKESLVDRTSGRPLSEVDAVFRAGPAASADMRERFDELQHQPR
jgi:hypothetical protein